MRRPQTMSIRWVVALIVGMGTLGGAALVSAGDFQVQGRFLYEDRIWDQFGYTGTVQNLPIRYADIEVVRDLGGGQIVATGSTDADGNYDILVTGLSGTVDIYVRCLSATDNATNYHIKVVDTFVRSGGTVNLGGSTIHAIITGTVAHDTNTSPLIMGDYLIQDTSGSGVAQAFNILDNGVDCFDYLNSSSGINRFPTAGEFVVFGWDGTTGSGGSNYFWQGIFIAATPTDTDGWSDAVILHEAGHWSSDMFGRDDNPGGSHFIGDNFQDPRLSYGEGYATFFCAQVREFRAPRLNLVSQPVDDHVSIYADLSIPPTVGTPGGLEFAYDFETGLFQTGTAIGQIGSASETNVTSAMWDLVDGTSTPDESPGSDDEPGDETGSLSWNVIQNHMTGQGGPDNWITVEDFYQGWFITHGAGFMQTEIDSAFIGLAGMQFFADGFEPDGTLGEARLVAPLSYSALGPGRVVINEIDLGSEDKVEFANAGTTAVDMTGWVLKSYRNGFATVTYTFPFFILHPGCHVVVHEGGSAANNGPVHLFGAPNFVWFNGGDGACTIDDDLAAAQDFVRWAGNTTPIPPGTAFTGSLASAPGGKNLGRDKDATDTDDASDFSNMDASMGTPNFSVVSTQTIFPENDVDLVRLDAMNGDLLVVQAQSPHSAGEPQLDLLDSFGGLLGSSSAANGISSQAELQFLSASDTTYYIRVKHIGPYTEFAPLSILIYKRPVAAVLSPPVALVADPENTTDTGDMVHMTWLNGGIYDQVKVYRDAVLIATLAGTATNHTDSVNRGAYEYAVEGLIGAQTTPQATATAFAGLLVCYFADGLESGTAGFTLESPWDRVSTIAESGTWSLHDSPAGDYGNNLNRRATVTEPVDLGTFPNLEFDHICITEATFDFGIVEISTDFGNSWTELARYDMDDHPGWNDGVANAGDWVHETFYLGDYIGEKVQVRFRLFTDAFVTEDGWYLDNIKISENTCETVTAVPDGDGSIQGMLTLAGANPFRSRLPFFLQAAPGTEARVQIFDTQGRLVRTLFTGLVTDGSVRLVWDGRDQVGRRSSAGFYLLRAVNQGKQAVQRLVKLP